jgi:hypothetical protein
MTKHSVKYYLSYKCDYDYRPGKVPRTTERVKAQSDESALKIFQAFRDQSEHCYGFKLWKVETFSETSSRRKYTRIIKKRIDP